MTLAEEMSCKLMNLTRKEGSLDELTDIALCKARSIFGHGMRLTALDDDIINEYKYYEKWIKRTLHLGPTADKIKSVYIRIFEEDDDINVNINGFPISFGNNYKQFFETTYGHVTAPLYVCRYIKMPIMRKISEYTQDSDIRAFLAMAVSIIYTMEYNETIGFDKEVYTGMDGLNPIKIM